MSHINFQKNEEERKSWQNYAIDDSTQTHIMQT